MPAAEAATSPQDRWDLVNYVRLLTNSAQSVGVGEKADPRKPFLPSIDFGFSLPNGEYRTLRDFEGLHPVLVILARDGRVLQARLAELRAHRFDLEKAGLLVILVAGPEARGHVPDEDPGPGMIVMTAGAAPVLDAWSHYRRTPQDPDPGNDRPAVAYQEFLVDRFGYVRAKWRDDAGNLPPIEAVIADVALLEMEGRILPPPEEHLH